MPVFSFSVLALVFGYTVFRYGGVLPEDWYPCLAALGLVSAVYYLAADRADRPPPSSLLLRLLIFSFLAVVILQLIPLPVGVVRLLSTARVELHEAIEPVLGAEPRTTITIVPAETFRLLLTAAGYVIVFFLVRELSWHWRDRPWTLAVPFVAVGLLEAVLGLLQYHWAGTEVARGTYINRNHFSGLLEMVLPFAVMGAVAVLRTDASAGTRRSPAGPAVKACIWLTVATVVLLAIIHSLSRMGFIASLGSLFVMGAAALGGGGISGRKRFLPVMAVAGLVIAGFIFLPTDQLIERFADMAATQDITADTRAQIWRDTYELIQDYPVLGCGIGCYESGLYRYKTVAPMNTVDFAHNDYLQLLAELGVVGFGILLVLGLRTIGKAVDAGAQPAGTEGRYLGIACVGSLTAIALHGLVDFNIYVPANAMLLVWIAAITEGLGSIGRQPSETRLGQRRAQQDAWRPHCRISSCRRGP